MEFSSLVKQAIQSVKIQKFPGGDEITAEIQFFWKDPLATHLFNLLIYRRSRCITQDTKGAIFITLH